MRLPRIGLLWPLVDAACYPHAVIPLGRAARCASCSDSSVVLLECHQQYHIDRGESIAYLPGSYLRSIPSMVIQACCAAVCSIRRLAVLMSVHRLCTAGRGVPIVVDPVHKHFLTLSGESLLHCCRQELHHLADGSAQEGTQAIHSRPGSPLWLNQRPGRLTAMFPVYMHGSPDDPLLSAFIQV